MNDDTLPTIVPGDPENRGIDDTQPRMLKPVLTNSATEVSSESQSNLPASDKAESDLLEQAVGNQKPPKKRSTWLVFSLLGLLAILIVAAISAFGGYRSGIGLRLRAEGTQIAQIAQEQFQLGVQEMEQGEYYRARQRFEYVVQLDSSYPGVVEKLAEVLLELNTTATPTLVPTPTLTPTPDLRGAQELFDQAQQYIYNSDWAQAIETLLTLRKNDIEFRAVDVDGMLFLAFRNLGKDKILKEADLEGGIYFLTLASRLGLLDAEVDGLLTWSTMYITGASFWDLDWEQAVYYFSQVAPQVPSLRDGSGMTASERYRIALAEYGNVLANQKEWCKAAEQFRASLAIGPDAQVEAALGVAATKCEQGAGPRPTKQRP